MAAWLYLSGPRVHVEEDPAEQLAVRPMHVVALHLRVPDRDVGPAPELDPEEPLDQPHQAGLDPPVLEVGPHRLGVEGELLGLDPVVEVGRVPRQHGRGVRLVDPLAGQQPVVVARGPVGRGGGDAVDEVGDVLRAADHLVLGRVLGPVRVAEQGGQLVPALEQRRQYVHVGRIPALAEQPPQLLAGGRVVGVGQERDDSRGSRW